MPPRVHGCDLHLASAAAVCFWLILSGLLLGPLSRPSAAQNTQGLAVVGSGSSTINSQMLIDATQFPSTDMCASIALACTKLGSSSSYPLGATIDARGFTGNQVCLAKNITTMLFACSPQGSSTNATGGKLLLGEVNLYADGPTLNPYYTDGSSGIGTPALIIPSMFWGIEGVSRGASTPNGANTGAGTFLSVCLGSNNPVGLNHLSPAPGSPSCSTAFPKRSYPIASTSVSTSNGVTTMTIQINSSNVTVYPGELVMVKGAPPGAPPSGDNGTFAIQSAVTGAQTLLKVTVPAQTATCSANCGNAILGTPILGFASTSKAYNDPSCFTSLCSGFGEHIKNLGFNCQSYDGCIGWQNLYAQEESGADTFVVDFFNFVGVDVHGGPAKGSQNFGAVLNAEIYTGAGNSACDFGTTGMYIGDAEMRGVNGWTINNSAESGSPPACANTPTAAVLFDAPNTEVSNGHCEGFSNCILMGANNAPGPGNLGASSQKISAVTGGPACASGTCSVVHISNNYPNNTDYLIQNIRRNVFTNTIQDDVNGITLGTTGNDVFTALYSWASGINNSPSTSTTNILTTDPSTRNQFGSGIRTTSVASGVLANTDLTGELNFLSATTASYTFSGAYASHPECTVLPQFNAGSTSFWITYAGTSQFTVHFSSAVTGAVGYTCSARN